MKLHLKIFIFIFLTCISLRAKELKTYENYESTKTLGAVEKIKQNNLEKGVVVIEGLFYKPITTSSIKLIIKYKNSENIWVDGWCKEFSASNVYNENLNVKLELPAKSSVEDYELKVDVTSSEALDLDKIYWNKFIEHYKEGDYKIKFIPKPKLEIGTNKYSVLLTPNAPSTLKYDSNGKLLALEDRAKTVPYHAKYYNEMTFLNSNSELKNDGLNNYILIKRKDTDTSDNFLVSTNDFIYKGSENNQYVFPYHDPIFVYAGKFPSEGFLIYYARYGSHQNGAAYYDFTDPNNLKGQIFGLSNNYNQKLLDIFQPGEPIVIASSNLTGTRIYKKDGTFFHLSGFSNYDSTSVYSGFPKIYYPNGAVEERGPGNERFYFKMKNGSEFSFYGMGVIGNLEQWGHNRPILDVEKDIKDFIDYTGVFDEKDDCSNNIVITINDGANSSIEDADWKKAPNSYIFDLNSDKSGLFIPVKKAYAMWKEGSFMGGGSVPSGVVTAEVYWEDIHGLIKSNQNYSLDIVGNGQNAKIKVPVNKVKKGNALIVYKVDGQIFWSWHVWVTDDPSNGSTYMSYDDTKRELSNGTIERIPANEWQWMDRNLGAVSAGITEEGWTRNNGLLYQWGRKDPIPPMVSKASDFYDISGSVGRVVHDENRVYHRNNIRNIDSFISYIPMTEANIHDNIRLSIKNPLSLIYVNYDNSNNQAFYDWYRAVPRLPVNWFGSTPFSNGEISKVNLWSDNSKGVLSANFNNNIHNNDETTKPYRDKSSYDPCPNGWRIPSMLVPNFGFIPFVGNYVNNLRFDFTPFGPKTNANNSSIFKGVGKGNIYNVRPKDDANTPSYLKGIKVYPGLGFDMTSFGGHDMGLFPGTGFKVRDYHGGVYTDMHEVYLWTASMNNW